MDIFSWLMLITIAGGIGYLAYEIREQFLEVNQKIQILIDENRIRSERSETKTRSIKKVEAKLLRDLKSVKEDVYKNTKWVESKPLQERIEMLHFALTNRFDAFPMYCHEIAFDMDSLEDYWRSFENYNEEELSTFYHRLLYALDFHFQIEEHYIKKSANTMKAPFAEAAESREDWLKLHSAS